MNSEKEIGNQKKSKEIEELKKRKNIFIIGIGGITRSGKSTLAKNLQKTYKGTGIFHMDGCIDKLVKKKDKNGNEFDDWEDPASYNFDFLYEKIIENLNSYPDENNPSQENINIVIIEGFLLYYFEKYCDLLDLAICIFISYEKCLERRKKSKGFYDMDYFDDLIWKGWHDRNKLFMNYFLEDKTLSINNIYKEKGILNMANKFIEENLKKLKNNS